MSLRSKAMGVLGATGLIVAALAAATPATASPSTNPFPALPATDTLFGVDCENTNAVYSIAPTATTAAATLIGTAVGKYENGVEEFECTGGIAYNPVDKFVYGVLWTYGDRHVNQMFPTSTGGNSLVKINPTTGVQAIVAAFSGPCSDPWAFAVDNSGLGYATDNSKLCSVNLATGVTTEIGTDVLGGSGEPSDYAMGYDWKNSVLYIFSSNYEIYSVNTSNGVATLAATLPVVLDEVTCPGDYTDSVGFDASAGFDSNGIAWIQSDTCNSTPVAWKPGTNEYWYAGQITAATDIVNTDSEAIRSAGDDFYIEGFTVVRGGPAPALAETGVEANEVPAGALIAGGLFLAGAVAWISRRRVAARR